MRYAGAALFPAKSEAIAAKDRGGSKKSPRPYEPTLCT